MKRTIRTALWLAALMCTAACVTVNVYFPAAQVDQVADEIVRDVYAGNENAPLPEELTAQPAVQDEDTTIETGDAAAETADEAEATADTAVENGPQEPEPATATERDLNGDNSGASRLLAFLEFFGPEPAYAGASDVSNSAIRGLRNQIAASHQKLVPYYQSGIIGINNTGLIEIRKTAGVPIAELAQVKRMVNEDNAARRALYKEVADAMNIPPNQVVKVQKSFADQWREDAPAGWQIQTDTGAWQTK